MMTIVYEIDNKLYINLTNRCTNQCKFCVRQFKAGVGDYNLQLEEEPTADEVIAKIDNPTEYEEIVFCGYGEPLIRLATLIEIATWLQDFAVVVRINTNGQANLIHGENIVPQLEGLIDVISISLNAKNAVKYQQLCNPEFGQEAFEAILEFIEECKRYIPRVVLSVVG